MPFFHFSQNNSGGSFDFSESFGITHHVVIEAKDADDANVIAIEKGLYFDGCDSGQDCHCCGDRWYRQSGDGDDVPTVYSAPLGEKRDGKSFFSRGWMAPGRETAVHFTDARIEWFNADHTKA